MKQKEQQGFVLFVVMVFLIIMSLLGISMFGGFIKDQKISGNMREKQRAIEAAQNSLDSVQSWMQSPGNLFEGSWNIGLPCTSSTQTGTTPFVCSNPLLSPATLPWGSSNTFNLPGGGTVGGATYASNASYYIQYLGTTPKNPPSAIYKVTATAQGGNATAAAVVETVYEVTVTARDIGGG